MVRRRKRKRYTKKTTIPLLTGVTGATFGYNTVGGGTDGIEALMQGDVNGWLGGVQERLDKTLRPGTEQFNMYTIPFAGMFLINKLLGRHNPAFNVGNKFRFKLF